jgi:cystathionine beta-lyase/cystathionine gamma-synthase
MGDGGDTAKLPTIFGTRSVKRRALPRGGMRSAGSGPRPDPRQRLGFGGMMSFVFDGDAETAASPVDRLPIFATAASLGAAESLVTQPTTTHRGLDPEERARRGIPDGMGRLSIGLEDTEDLIEDLEQALG